MIDHPGMKLGRLPSPVEKRATTLGLSDYLEQLPAAPRALNLATSIPSWPMFANDHLGDCTCAAIAHMLEIFTLQVDGTPKLLTDNDVIALYNLVNGGVDEGADMIQVLSTLRHVGIAGDKILAYVDVRTSDLELIRAGCWLFSGLYIGINLPLTAQMQTGHSMWSVVPDSGHQGEPGGWGGHAVDVVAYDETGPTVVTWGALQQMTWEFWSKYVDECYVVLPSEYDRLSGKALENGFNEEQLRADLGRFGNVSQ